MAGGSGPRNVNSRYQRARQDADARENASDGRRQRARNSGSRRGRPPLVRPHDVPEERRTTDSSEDEQVLATDEVRATDSEGEAQGAARPEVVPLPLLRLAPTCEVPQNSLASASSPTPSDPPPGGQVTNFRFNHSYFI